MKPKRPASKNGAQLELGFSTSYMVREVTLPSGAVRLEPDGKVQYWSVKVVMKFLGESEDTIYRLIESGDLEGQKRRPGVRKSHWRIISTSALNFQLKRQRSVSQ